MTFKQHSPILDLTLRSARFRRSLVNHIERFIAELPPGSNAREGQREMTEKRTAALSALANHVSQLEIEDARLFQLSEIARSAPGTTGWAHTQNFQPTVTQRQILGALGRGGEVKDLDRVINLLISGGLADALRGHGQHYAETEQRTSEAVAARRAAEQKAEPLARTQAELAAAQNRIANLEDEVVLRQRQLSDAQAFLAAPGSDRPRRVHVTGETGIYTALVDGETRLEVGYSDDQGKQRWKRLASGASIEDARWMRARFAGKPHNPEHGGLTEEELDATDAPPPSEQEHSTGEQDAARGPWGPIPINDGGPAPEEPQGEETPAPTGEAPATEAPTDESAASPDEVPATPADEPPVAGADEESLAEDHHTEAVAKADRAAHKPRRPIAADDDAAFAARDRRRRNASRPRAGKES